MLLKLIRWHLLGKPRNTTSAQGILSCVCMPLVAPSQPAPSSKQGKILEKMGVCTEITFTRYMRSGTKRGPEPQLCLQDMRFDGVPVRLYLPCVPSAALRPATIFFHGGGWIYCSIGREGEFCPDSWEKGWNGPSFGQRGALGCLTGK